MTSRFRRQPSNILEIRGISRGSMIDHPRVEGVNDVLPGPTISRELNYYDSINPSTEIDSDDDDESTVVGEPFGIHSPHSPSHIDDTVTASDTSQYWSAGNSFTTGNTTERSSVYSWGDDEFDLQTSRMVREMFQAIEQMLFEGVLSGSTSLQHECREWMGAFPHLRILGKQVAGISSRDDGFESLHSSDNASSSSVPPSIPDTMSDVLEIRGLSMPPSRIPVHLLSSLEQESGRASSTTDFSHLYEEVFAEDGKVEEYLAYDIREMDEEEHSKKYHVPRRRRLGFPPITPNACVRDAVLQLVFDRAWSHVVSCLSGPTETKPTPLLKLLVENQVWSQERSSQDGSLHNSNSSDRRMMKFQNNNHQIYPCDDDVMYDRLYPPTVTDRQRGHVGPTYITPQLPHRIFYPDSLGLPPSRGSYLEQIGAGRPLPFSSGRLTAPYHAADPHSLSDLMKISQKKLQTRADRLAADDVVSDPLHEPVARFHSTSHFLNGSGQGLASTPQHLSVVGHVGTPNPFTPTNRQNPSKELTFRQQSATGRKGRGRGRRLMPLDRSKTPNIDHNDLNVTATKLLPGNFEPPMASFGGGRINSPPSAFQPPPTAPNPSIGSVMWVNSKLPPISSQQLEALPENTLSDFKKTRGKTAHTRISSAVADEKLARGMIENLSRPNTTHTFRAENLVSKRATSVTPSNFIFGNSALKSNSPAGGSYNFSTGGVPYPYHSSSSPDNFAGLVGITGRSINFSNVGHPSSPEESTHVVPHASWGISSQTNISQTRKKRPPLA